MPPRYLADRTAARWRPIKSPKSAWATVMRAIETKYGARWRWHDIRAAFIIQVTPLSGGVAAQKLARHSDFATTQGYTGVAHEVMRRAADHATWWPTLRRLK